MKKYLIYKEHIAHRELIFSSTDKHDYDEKIKQLEHDHVSYSVLLADDDLKKDYDIYIPFINMYKDTVKFAYDGINGTITSSWLYAYYTSSLEAAIKMFKKNLSPLYPKNLWQDYGLLKLSKREYFDFKPTYKTNMHNQPYISIDDLKQFAFVKIGI